MRAIPSVLEAALASGITTHCQCWLLTRRDGYQIGLTDHDVDLAIGAILFEAASGFSASAIEAESGLATGGGEISGAISSARILPTDIEAGLYDGARLETYLVDWNNPALDFLINAATLGEIRRSDGRFVAETRDAFHALDQERGRLYAAGCSAELGDIRCGVNLSAPPYRMTGVVATTDGRQSLVSSQVASTAAGFFTRGAVRFTTGANAGAAAIIKDHRGGGEVVLWQSLGQDLMPGDQFIATAGCDKRLSTCRDRFDNAVNFRGFPFIPAPDFVLTYARPGEGRHRGRPLVR